MPFAPKAMEGEAPAQAHLAIMTDESGLWTAIPPGARMLIVEDPTRLDRIQPLILAKVTRTKLIFRCGCGEDTCTRIYVYAAAKAGWHRSRAQQDAAATAAELQGSGKR
jgi:hypothetical protein